jgi:hypothetical protein
VGVLVAACGGILELNGLYLGFTLVAWSTLGILIGFVAVSIVVWLWRQSQPSRPGKTPEVEEEDD